MQVWMRPTQPQGSLWFAQPMDVEAQDMLLRGTNNGESQWFGGSLVVEARHVGDFIRTLQDDGVEVLL